MQVVLTSKQTSTKLENVTEEGGSFSFTNLQSGQYVLEFAHPSWKFSQNKINVEISNDNADLDKLGKAIEVLSYSFSASVLSDSRPMGDVQFLLFGNKVSSFNYECNRARPALVDKLVEANNDIEYLCYVLSNNEGVVKLNLPNGKYALHPFYERHGIRFDVSPVKYEFEILHDDIVETEAFEIGGFTITGKVVNSLNPNIPVNDAQVVLLQHNSVITSTHVNPTTGWYKFENIKTSDYVIRTKATHFLFEDVAVSISPNNPQLPTLSPSKYRVCANVELDPNLQAHQVELVIKNKNSNAIFKRLPIVSNNVCEFLPGAHYLFSVVSKSSELKFVPAELLVNVDQPKTDLQFTQFSTRISGQIEFSNSQEALKANDDSALILQKSGVVLEMINVADLKRTNNLISFQFKNILPGKYSLSLGGKLKTTFCWQKDSFDINVEESDVPNVNFKQNGYHFQAVSSHATALQLKSPSGKLETHNVETGKVLEHCLQEPGRYQLIPIGCHKFVEDGEHLFYDTQQTEGEIVKLVALKHSAKVVIVSDINITDLSLNVDVMHHNQQHRRQIALPELQASQADGHYQYSLVLYERPTSNIQIEPKSEQLLFRPSTAVVDLSNDCAVEDVVFKARAGMFINGHVEGDIDGVQIDVFDKQSDALLATAFTAADGRYTVGPFDADLKVKLVAAKEGYTFKSSPTILGKFAPQKHSSFRVNIVDVEGLPLRDVLVSISGGENNFRKNSFVDEDGSIKFDRLDDGEYFIRFVRKEYQFDPSSEMVTLADGQSFERTVVGTQVAFSCFGNVVSLNGEPEVGVAIEAVGVAAGVGSAIDCAAQQEETVSEADGTFRIMGLLPECEYTVRLKVDDRDAIRESVPTRYTIRPTNNDTKDVRFMIVYKQFQTDLVASIEVDEAILPSLSVSFVVLVFALLSVCLFVSSFFSTRIATRRTSCSRRPKSLVPSSSCRSCRWTRSIIPCALIRTWRKVCTTLSRSPTTLSPTKVLCIFTSSLPHACWTLWPPVACRR